jgi:hypothetical protein
MSFVSRCVVLLVSLGTVIAGIFIGSKVGPLLLLFGVPALLLFVVEERNIILRPGNSVVTNPLDERLAFFKGRNCKSHMPSQSY